jgi:hypothetical protein
MDMKAFFLLQAAAHLPIFDGKAMMLPIAPAVASEISLDYHLTLEVLRSGHGDEYHLGSMAQAIYTAMFLGQMKEASVRAGLFPEAKAAVLRCRRTGLETGVWVADEHAYSVLGEILTLFDQQLAAVPLYQFKKANESLKMISSAKHVDRKNSAIRV